jgi:hypothetical protein
LCVVRKHSVTPIRVALEQHGIEFLVALSINLEDGRTLPIEGKAILLPDGSMIRLQDDPANGTRNS